MTSFFRYALRRLGFYGLAAWAAVTLNFLLPRWMSGDPAQTLLGRFEGQLSPEALERMQLLLGQSDQGTWAQYWGYIKGLFAGDLGVSVSHYPQPVIDVVASSLGWTILLAGSAVVVAFVLGTVLGALCAWKRGGVLDNWLPAGFALISAFPYFWLAMLLSFGLAFQWDLFPIRHAYGSHVEPSWSWAFVDSVLRHLFLPAFTLVLASMAGWILTMRSGMIRILGTESIAYARARGLSERRVFWHYATRNAIVPSLTSFGMALGFVVSGTLLTEIIFSYPGQGYVLIQAVQSQDYPLLQGLFLTISLSVLLANFLVDLLVATLDPRTRS
jgi:peptide/nickel transport system permease protein